MVFDSLKNKFQLRFKNREFAARILAGALEDSLRMIKVDKNQDNLMVLGIPRGGVVVADIVVSKLKSSYYSTEFDIIIPRKLGAPGNQEIAIGAIMDDSTTCLNDELIKELEISQEHIEKEKTRQIGEIRRRQSLYRRDLKKEFDIENKIVILVDDGAATGATSIAAARCIIKGNSKKLIIAIPVTSKDTANMLKKECNLVVTGTIISSTSTFKSVGQYYQEFKPIEDYRVVEICKKNNSLSC